MGNFFLGDVNEKNSKKYIKKNYDNVEVHLSTQASTLNKEAVEFWKNEGVSRVVLAREVMKEEMEEIINQKIINTEKISIIV